LPPCRKQADVILWALTPVVFSVGDSRWFDSQLAVDPSAFDLEALGRELIAP